MATDPCGFSPARQDRRGTAAMEFAIIAPVMVTLIWGVFDLARALVAWEETYHAAEAIAQAAEKLSVTNSNYPGTTKPLTALTASEMQDAMWLNLGQGTGAFTGGFAVTLSGVSFEPLCVASVNTPCPVQKPNVLWSSYLSQGYGQLLQPPQNNPKLYWRLCGYLQSVAKFPNDNTQLTVMIDPNKVPGGVTNLINIPQVVADVQFSYSPSFPLLSNFSYTFYASATFPAPLGGDDQEIVYDARSPGNVESCANGNPYTG